MAQEEEQLTVFLRGMEREREGREITERPAGPVKAEKHQHVRGTDTGLSVFHSPGPLSVLGDLTLLHKINEDGQPV